MAATNDGRAIAGGPAQPVYITNAAGDPVPITGGGGGGGGAVTIADGADITQGAKADAAATTDAGTFSLIALFKRLLQKLTTQLPAALAAGGGLKIEGVAGGVAVPIGGTVASGAADSGNPVKVGGKYNATPPTLTDGQRGDIQMDAQGGQKVSGTWFKPTVSTVSALNGDILAAFDASGYQSGAFQLSGTWVGSVQVQASLDSGTPWAPVYAASIAGGSVGNTITANGMHVFAVPPGALIRLRVIAYTSGTVVGNIGFSAQPVSSLSLSVSGTTVLVTASGNVASGSADSGNPVKTGGKYNATLPAGVTDGNRIDTQVDINGFARVATAATLIKTATPTVSTSPAYSAGDSIGGLISLTSAVRYAAGGGTITSVVISDKAKQSAAIDVVFFTANPGSTTFTDNAALAVNAADLISIVGVISVTTYSAFSANSVGSALGQSLPFVLASGTTLYAALVSRGTPTYASTSDIQLTVGIRPN